ncbi:hypothetical protein HXX76_009617 [Chlamydomonas incerta]|uniref:Uncharacterized protein n=1 Tax=Chlamydomonas incerta TaxID=51695 RepID=A0A835VZ82_CHLIN|nr:hypothetical protein HXX76_009617 [Chlamydomonas incerta]|eukprot:KAG2431084.1 hypothetical protein HXX76_009617 [Chlamydomonas incerta]
MSSRRHHAASATLYCGAWSENSLSSPGLVFRHVLPPAGGGVGGNNNANNGNSGSDFQTSSTYASLTAYHAAAAAAGCSTKGKY